MKVLGIALVLLVALEHLAGARDTAFMQAKITTARFYADHILTRAANQGLYNGFLAAGLLWGLVYPGAAAGVHIQMFFLACVIVAGIYGGLTVSRRILYLQGGPALLALLVLLAG